MIARRAALAPVAALALLVSGCADHIPAAPQPFTNNLSGGYVESAPAADVVEVRYLGPYWRTAPNGPSRTASAESARAHARDMALWRSAKLAIERGFRAVEVIDSASALDFRIPSLPRFTYAYLIPTDESVAGPIRYQSLFGPFGRYSDLDHHDQALLRVCARVTARLLPDIEPGARDAADLAADIAARYGFANRDDS